MSLASAELSRQASNRSARAIVLALTAIGLAVGLVATARLALVVAATPTGAWFNQEARLIDPAVAVTASVANRAEIVSGLVDDPSLIRSRFAVCNAVPPDGSDAAGDARCVEIIDQALRANPSSGELWLFKATILARSNTADAAALAALRNSFATAPREAWIASARVVLGLRLWPLLPADLQESVRRDLALVLSTDFVRPLSEAYASDFSLRQAAAPALLTLPKDLLDEFVSAVRTSIRPAGPPA